MNPTTQKGFVLALTLWILVILTLAASFFALWTQRIITIAQSAQDEIQGEIDLHNTQATLLYLLSTQRFTLAGLTLPLPEELANVIQERQYSGVEEVLDVFPQGNEITLDDRVYSGYGKAYFALQDLGGLIHLNYPTEEMFTRLLGFLGVESELRAPLIAKLEDYIDLDDLHRLNGAEAYHYERRGLPPPPNRPLLTQIEARNILDWAEQTSLWQDNVFAQLTTTLGRRTSLYPNFNTAPLLVLQAAYQMDEEAAKRFIEARQQMPFYAVKTVEQVVGFSLVVDDFEAVFFSSTLLRLTLWYENAQQMRQIYLRLSHDADGKRPWEYQYRLNLKLIPIEHQAAPHPASTTLFSPTFSATSP